MQISYVNTNNNNSNIPVGGWVAEGQEQGGVIELICTYIKTIIIVCSGVP